MAAAVKFAVRRQPAILVAPAGPTPRELKWLSDIDDQEGLRFHVANLLIYRDDGSIGGRDPAPVIRAAIARALVHYYPFAGRLRGLEGRKLAVDCTGEGVLFIEADADVRLDHLGDAPLPPFPCEAELLFDVPGSSALLGTPLLLFQVTRLACDGFILGVRLQHAMADASGVVQFLGAVAELARGAPALTVKPVWRRELLLARAPPRPSFAHRAYDEAASSNEGAGTGIMAHRSVFFGTREVAAVRSQLPAGLRQRATTFDIVAGCLWRCRTAALARDAHEQMRLVCTVNLRGRKSAVPHGYYGNAFAFQAAVGHAVGLVNEAKSDVVDMEYMQSLADLMVQRGRPRFEVAGAFLLSDVTKVGFGDLDFGWGKPLFGGPSCAGPVPGLGSFIIGCKDGVVVPVFLPGRAMEKFVEELGKILYPAVNITSAL